MSVGSSSASAYGSLGSISVNRRNLLGKGGAFAAWLCLVALAASTLYPLIFLVVTTLRTQGDYMRSPGGLPQQLTTENISGAFTQVHVGRLALNSLAVVVPSVLLVTAVACLAAYALVHTSFPLRKVTLAVVVALMALPPVIILIPLFKVVVDIGLLNHRLGLILVYATITLPFSIYLLASFMKAVPMELLNAARVDGAGSLRILWSVVLPLVRPGLLTLLTFNFLFLWNEFLFSLVILQDNSYRTIMVGIAQFQGNFDKNFGVVTAGLMLSMIPPLLVFIFFQRDLARGLTAGAVK